eukprot:8779731-Alexandrium_andersonii.AAC.1
MVKVCLLPVRTAPHARNPAESASVAVGSSARMTPAPLEDEALQCGHVHVCSWVCKVRAPS